MRLGYFGGTFDPPHLGHLAVARAAASAFLLDRVLFVPTANQPLKPEAARASYADRLAMVALLCQQEPRFEASALEAPTTPPLPNYTVDTLARLHAERPADELFVVVGEDAFHDLPKWRSPERLLMLADWIVVNRTHHAETDRVSLPPLTPAQRERVHLMPGFDHPASATAIRNEMALGRDCSETLSPAVLAYIRAHHLYA